MTFETTIGILWGAEMMMIIYIAWKVSRIEE